MAVLGLGLAVAAAALTLQALQMPLTAAERNYEVDLERIEGYEMNPEYVAPDSYIRVRRRDKESPPGLYHTLTTAKVWPNDTEVEGIIYELRDNKAIPGWFKYRRNFCDYLAHETMPILKEVVNIWHYKPCPFQGSYKVENWRPDDRVLPPVLPGPNVMMLSFKWTTGSTLILKLGIVFSVDRSKAKRGRGGRG